MATKGKLTDGTSNANCEFRIIGQLYTFDTGDEITSIHAYLSISTAAKNVNAAIYNTSGTRLALGSELASQAADTGLQWYEIPISYTVGATTDLIIAVCASSGSGDCNIRAVQSTTAATSYWDFSATHEYPPVATWTAGFGSDIDYDLSLYATYTPASAPTVTKLKLTTHSSAASATGVAGWVVGDDNTTYYGYFSGQSFEADLDGGEAVLKVAVADISPDGATLTTSDTPQVVVRNATFGTTMCDATVIEE